MAICINCVLAKKDEEFITSLNLTIKFQRYFFIRTEQVEMLKNEYLMQFDERHVAISNY
jgi:hypothetical protein